MNFICIPVLDEAPTIGVLLWRIRQVMLDFQREFQILVVDDASTDATLEVLEPYQSVLPLTVLRNERTEGYAASVERLVREAVHRSTHPRRDAVVLVQGDFTEPVEEIPALLRRLEGGADLVGSTVSGTDIVQGRGLRWSRRGLPWLLGRSGLPEGAGDPFSGFRAYRVQVLRRALHGVEGAFLTRYGWAANAELLVRAAPHARRADQLPVTLRYGRRQRPTRFLPWPTLREAWRLARIVPRRSAGASAEAVTETEAAPGTARRGRSGQRKRGRTDGDSRRSTGNGDGAPS